MTNEEKLIELNDKIDLLTSQLQAEYLTEYQIRRLMYRLDNLTISRDILQNKINRDITNNNKNINIMQYICTIIQIIYLLILIYLIVSL